MSQVYLAPSRISGTGVFAARRLCAGEHVLSFAEGTPQVVPYAATVRCPEQEGNYVQVAAEGYILPAPPSLYLNHSCTPNTGVRDATEIVTLDTIEAGDELTFDYSTSMAEDGWEIDCACGSRLCRGRIRDFKHLPFERQLYYIERDVVADFCLATITTPAR
ncbi:MAG TPA: SET domain-containing protein-lysine N-methyltransferase [Pyrinomonadaceae bacterium]|nr:SET domain-containing protein-lysine N-methyltransferase [Pyrinomonadaceae bacterium]